jgi:transcriptional regulator with XRE-family HTH domain
LLAELHERTWIVPFIFRSVNATDLLRVEKPQRVLADLGLRIAELRHGRGWTQARLAERLDVSVRYVARVESGVNISVLTLCGIARALGVRTATLFEMPSSREARLPGRPKRSVTTPGPRVEPAAAEPKLVRRPRRS